MSIQAFLEKARIKKDRELKAIKLEVEGFGEAEFFRPKQEAILDFMEMSEDEKSMKEMAPLASKFVYLCSNEMQSKEVRDFYKNIDTFQIPLEVFGITKTVEVATELFTKFENIKEVEEAVKN